MATKNTVRLSLRILGEPVAIESPQPPANSRLDQILPIGRAIDNAAVDKAIEWEAQQGRSISCTKGCSACCRAQPVPVTPPEAYALLRVVEAMPEPRQSRVRALFARNVQTLNDEGLADQFLNRSPDLDAAKARDIAMRYFRLGLVCPFLENDSCGVYEDRPFVCRQYLVTSPASECVDPFTRPIQQVKMPIAAAGATLALAEKKLGRPQYTVPLALALVYAQQHRAELERTFPAEPMMKLWLEELKKG